MDIEGKVIFFTISLGALLILALLVVAINHSPENVVQEKKCLHYITNLYPIIVGEGIVSFFPITTCQEWAK